MTKPIFREVLTCSPSCSQLTVEITVQPITLHGVTIQPHQPHLLLQLCRLCILPWVVAPPIHASGWTTDMSPLTQKCCHSMLHQHDTGEEPRGHLSPLGTEAHRCAALLAGGVQAGQTPRCRLPLCGLLVPPRVSKHG